MPALTHGHCLDVHACSDAWSLHDGCEEAARAHSAEAHAGTCSRHGHAQLRAGQGNPVLRRVTRAHGRAACTPADTCWLSCASHNALANAGVVTSGRGSKRQCACRASRRPRRRLRRRCRGCTCRPSRRWARTRPAPSPPRPPRRAAARSGRRLSSCAACRAPTQPPHSRPSRRDLLRRRP